MWDNFTRQGQSSGTEWIKGKIDTWEDSWAVPVNPVLIYAIALYKYSKLSGNRWDKIIN